MAVTQPLLRTPRRRLLIGGGTALLAGGLGIFAAFQFNEKNQILNDLWQLPLQDWEGKPYRLDQWRGYPTILNFWATWCAPCREEMPLLAKAFHDYASKNVRVVGISLDSAANVRQFAKELNIPYALPLGSIGAIEITRKLGNVTASLPYTVGLNRTGDIASRHLGGLSQAQLELLIAATLR